MFLYVTIPYKKTSPMQRHTTHYKHIFQDNHAILSLALVWLGHLPYTWYSKAWHREAIRPDVIEVKPYYQEDVLGWRWNRPSVFCLQVFFFRIQQCKPRVIHALPANTRCSSHNVLILGQRRRRWPSIKAAMVQRLMFAVRLLLAPKGSVFQ